MGTKEQIVQLLQDPVIEKVDFWLGGLHVNGDRLRKVGKAIKDGDIAIQVKASWRSGATYRIRQDLLILRQDTVNGLGGMTSNGIIVHECVHAIIDMTKAGNRKRPNATTALSGEAAGYIAQVMYHRLKTNRALSSRSPQVFLLAEKIIEDKGMLNKKGVTLAWAEYEQYRRDLKRLKYRSYGLMEKHGGDGLVAR
jgi:hypothetical protein